MLLTEAVGNDESFVFLSNIFVPTAEKVRNLFLTGLPINTSRISVQFLFVRNVKVFYNLLWSVGATSGYPFPWCISHKSFISFLPCNILDQFKILDCYWITARSVMQDLRNTS